MIIEPLTAFALTVAIALLFGALFSQFNQPAILGYMFAGLFLGPSGLKILEDRNQIEFLAELGVMTLLFTIGTELPVKVLRRVWKPALITCLLQTFVALAIMLPLAWVFMMEWQVGLLWSFILALSSTAVVMKILIALNIIASPAGKVISGILIGQDILFIPMMAIIAALATRHLDAASIAHIVFSLLLLVFIIVILGRRETIKLPLHFVKDPSSELIILRATALCFGASALAGLLGLSPAYGAFLIGLILAHSSEREHLLTAIKPLSNLLMMMFFISIGMLIDLSFILQHVTQVLLVAALVVFLKTFFTILIVRLSGEPWAHALIAGVLLAQIGEFSFLLAQQGLLSGLIDHAAYNLIIAITVLSLILTPLWLHAARRIIRFAMKAKSWQEALSRSFGNYASLSEMLETVMSRLHKKPPPDS